MRTCPECKIELGEIPYRDQHVDQCARCKGLYFDAGELEAIVEIMRLYGRVVLDEPEIDAVPELERSRRVACPDDGAEMEAQQVGPLTMDVCPACAGIWLDDGELSALLLAEQNIRDNLNLYIRLGE